MALFTDGMLTDVDALKAYESSIVSLAQRECIDLHAKLAVSYEELHDWILAYLLDRGVDDPQASARRGLGLSTLVVSRPLRRWQTLKALELVYRDAHHGQLNERYKENWQHYRKAAEEARVVWLRTGPGFVRSPVVKGGRPIVEANAGAWPAGIFRVQIQWVDAQGVNGEVGEVVAAEVHVNGGIRVSLSALPHGAAGWHLFVGWGDREPVRQNATTIAGLVWTSSGTAPDESGGRPAAGQEPELYCRVSQVRL